MMRVSFFSILATLAGSSEAFFSMTCPGRVVRTRLDPIVTPGRVSGHVHTISGGEAFAASMSYEDMRGSNCSSCPIKEDMSNYWTPQLYVKFRNGTFMPVPQIGDRDDTSGGMTIYYLQRRGPDPNEKLHAFPPGFRMVAGDPFARSFNNTSAGKAITFACLGRSDNRGQAEPNRIPDLSCPGGLRAQVFFPACWNGRDVDVPDHKSHMSYPLGGEYNTGPCPAEFPVHMISLFYEVIYDVDIFLSEWDQSGKHPFVFAQGDATGYGFHGDFANGWDVDVLQRAVDTCTDASGLVSRCAPLTQFSRAENQDCKIAEGVREVNDGLLPKLPGCNPVSYGPERAAPPQACADTATLGVRENFVDLTAAKGWSYLGCGTDSVSARAFSGPSFSRADTTVHSCVDFCGSRGYTYAGLEYSRECFCGNELKAANAPKEGVWGKCLMKCAGDRAQICGGSGAMSVYRKCAVGEACVNNEEFGSATKVQRRRFTGEMSKARAHAREVLRSLSGRER